MRSKGEAGDYEQYSEEDQYAGLEADTVRGSIGNDVIDARDGGLDPIGCGLGDKAYAGTKPTWGGPPLRAPIELRESRDADDTESE